MILVDAPNGIRHVSGPIDVPFKGVVDLVAIAVFGLHLVAELPAEHGRTARPDGHDALNPRFEVDLVVGGVRQFAAAALLLEGVPRHATAVPGSVEDAGVAPVRMIVAVLIAGDAGLVVVRQADQDVDRFLGRVGGVERFDLPQQLCEALLDDARSSLLEPLWLAVAGGDDPHPADLVLAHPFQVLAQAEPEHQVGHVGADRPERSAERVVQLAVHDGRKAGLAPVTARKRRRSGRGGDGRGAGDGGGRCERGRGRLGEGRRVLALVV